MHCLWGSRTDSKCCSGDDYDEYQQHESKPTKSKRHDDLLTAMEMSFVIGDRANWDGGDKAARVSTKEPAEPIGDRLFTRLVFGVLGVRSPLVHIVAQVFAAGQPHGFDSA